MQRFWLSVAVASLLAACSGNDDSAASHTGSGGTQCGGSGGVSTGGAWPTGGAAGSGGAPSGGNSGSGGSGGTGGTPSQGFVTQSGTSFQRDGKDYRFVGANVRGITHYGQGDALPYADGSQIELNLSSVGGMKGKVIRAFVAYQGIGAQATGDRLGAVLDAMLAHDLTMIVVLTDFYATPFHPKGDDGYYATDGNGYTVLDHDFFASGYGQNYKPLVQALATRFKDHPAIFSWELGNEIRDATFGNSSGATFVAFCQDMAATIRALDPNHMISVGEISAQNNGLSQAQAGQLYSDPNISFLTDRSYDGGGPDDSGFAASLGKPLIVEEAGYQSGNRPSEIAADVSGWFGKGARGYLQWGFMAAGSDNGDGDTSFGMDKVFHSDWDGLQATYSSAAP
jgi:mannan endo-1,4-beta-mannosidase